MVPLEPKALADPRPMIPLLRVVLPLYVLEPDSIRVPPVLPAEMVRSPAPVINPESVARLPFWWNVLTESPEGDARVQLAVQVPELSTTTVPPVSVVLQGLVMEVLMPVSSTFARAS